MSGFVIPEVAITEFAEHARLKGSTILTSQRVRDWHASKHGVTVQTDSTTYSADHLILTAGAWTSLLLESLKLNLTVTRQVLGWVAPPDPAPFQLGRFPVWGIDSQDGGIYYGFPMLPDVPGLKLAHHLPGQPFDPDNPSRDPVPADEHDFRPVLRQHIPCADGPLVTMKICLYTNSVDHHFILDTHPDHNRVTFACGFSGHGFKFASVIGDILAQRVTLGSWDSQVEFLRLRPVSK
jgi:sarcosine oxidase